MFQWILMLYKKETKVMSPHKKKRKNITLSSKVDFKDADTSVAMDICIEPKESESYQFSAKKRKFNEVSSIANMQSYQPSVSSKEMTCKYLFFLSQFLVTYVLTIRRTTVVSLTSVLRSNVTTRLVCVNG